MNTRLMLNQDGRMVDEYLEVCFKQIFDWHVRGKQGKAVEILLDEYTVAVWGKSAVSCKGSISDINVAILWATQFGELRLFKLDAKTAEALNKKEGYNSELNFSGKIGPDNPRQSRVAARTAHQVILLAGIQVLRETADSLLNKADSTAH